MFMQSPHQGSSHFAALLSGAGLADEDLMNMPPTPGVGPLSGMRGLHGTPKTPGGGMDPFTAASYFASMQPMMPMTSPLIPPPFLKSDSSSMRTRSAKISPKSAPKERSEIKTEMDSCRRSSTRQRGDGSGDGGGGSSVGGQQGMISAEDQMKYMQLLNNSMAMSGMMPFQMQMAAAAAAASGSQPGSGGPGGPHHQYPSFGYFDQSGFPAMMPMAMSMGGTMPSMPAIASSMTEPKKEKKTQKKAAKRGRKKRKKSEMEEDDDESLDVDVVLDNSGLPPQLKKRKTTIPTTKKRGRKAAPVASSVASSVSATEYNEKTARLLEHTTKTTRLNEAGEELIRTSYDNEALKTAFDYIRSSGIVASSLCEVDEDETLTITNAESNLQAVIPLGDYAKPIGIDMDDDAASVMSQARYRVEGSLIDIAEVLELFQPRDRGHYTMGLTKSQKLERRKDQNRQAAYRARRRAQFLNGMAVQLNNENVALKNWISRAMDRESRMEERIAELESMTGGTGMGAESLMSDISERTDSTLPSRSGIFAEERKTDA